MVSTSKTVDPISKTSVPLMTLLSFLSSKDVRIELRPQSHPPFSILMIVGQVDVANNILVDATGDEYQCTDTDLTPADVNQVSTW